MHYGTFLSWKERRKGEVDSPKGVMGCSPCIPALSSCSYLVGRHDKMPPTQESLIKQMILLLQRRTQTLPVSWFFVFHNACLLHADITPPPRPCKHTHTHVHTQHTSYLSLDLISLALCHVGTREAVHCSCDVISALLPEPSLYCSE